MFSYPSEEDLAQLTYDLSTGEFRFGAEALAELIKASGIGSAELDVENQKLRVTTGGWSGCEEILHAASRTVWWLVNWESTHRGGLYLFEGRPKKEDL